MKNYKFIAAIAIIGAMLTSCNDDGYWDNGSATDVPSAGVACTFNNAKTSFTFYPADVVSQVSIPVTRTENTKAEKLLIHAVTSDSIVSFPDTIISFAAGEAQKEFVVKLSRDLKIGETVNAKLSFDSTYVSRTSVCSTSVTISKDYNWVDLGTGKFADYWMFENTYDANIQQAEQNPNLFRVVDPYSQGLDEEGYTPDYVKAGPCSYIQFEVLKKGDVLAGQTLTQDDIVYYDMFNTGYYYTSYEAEVLCIHPASFSKTATEEYWLHNKVTAYQENGLPATVQLAPYYYMIGVGGWNYSQKDGVLTITFPGVKIYDYDVEVEYTGREYDADEEQSIKSSISWGADVAYAKVCICPEAAENDSISAIIAGKAGTTLTKAGDFTLPMIFEESGKYVVLAVAFDEKGVAQNVSDDTFKYTASGEVPETWTPTFVGTYTYTLFFGTASNPYDDEGLVLSVSDKNSNRFKISGVFYAVDFIFEMDPETGVLSFEDQETGYEYEGKMIYVSDMQKYDGFAAGTYADGAFTFSIGYHDGSNFLTYGTETFTLTGNYSSSVKDAKYNLAKRLQTNNKIKINKGFKVEIPTNDSLK